jgi:hypothetical protein
MFHPWRVVELFLSRLLSRGANDDSELARKLVKININGGIAGLADCASGSGSRSPVEEFACRAMKSGLAVRDSKKRCGLSQDEASRIMFLRQ